MARRRTERIMTIVSKAGKPSVNMASPFNFALPFYDRLSVLARGLMDLCYQIHKQENRNYDTGH